MSSIRYALLSLLAREPLSGYDIKQQMNSRLNPFWKAGSNQVYPELSKMEKDGFIYLKEVEQHAYRPDRKLYGITETGREAIIQWMIEPDGVENMRDDFLLKIYDSWLVEPEKMEMQIENVKKQHEEKLAAYLIKIKELTQLKGRSEGPDPIAASLAVVEFGVQYERLYIDWCDNLLNKV